MFLSDIRVGENVWVSAIEESPLRPKLIEMGIDAGRLLTILFKAPFGDPIAVQVGDYVLSLRLDEASLIRVKSE